MAGGKETPRQKMIGMMYLVLTALLALNVSAAIMEKFAALKISMEAAVKESQDRIDARIKGIEASVKERGDQETDKKVLDDAKKVKAESKKVIDFMESLKQELITMSGGQEEGNPMPTGAKDQESTTQLMVGTGGVKNGKGYELEKKLNDYVKTVNAIEKSHGAKDTRPNLALHGSEDPLTKNSGTHKTWDFAQVNFEETPVVAALAVLSNFQGKVANIEGEVINMLAGKVGAADFKLNEIFPMVRAKSSIVAAGTYYEAEMFVSGSITGLDNPKMVAPGLQKVENGIGYIKFKVDGGAYDKEGLLKKSWTGSIEVPNPLTGKPEAKEVKTEYQVAKPVIQIQSASVSALYLNCGNELNVQVPALGSEYSPSFSATGATVTPGANKGMVTVVPSAANVELSVSSGGSLIGKEPFKVRTIPKPTIEALVSGKPVNEKQGVSSPGPRSVTIKAVPDESFKNFLPKDARYRITEWEALLVRGKRPVETKKFTSETGDFSSFASKAQPGDRIVIDVKSVKRMNYKGNIEDVKLGTIIKNIPLN